MKKVPAHLRLLTLGLISIIIVLGIANIVKNNGNQINPISFLQKKGLIPTSKPTPTPIPTPTPTPKPLTFAELNALYGPCVYLPVLYYHHIDNYAEAKAKALTVDIGIFQKQMDYLQSQGYQAVSMRDLINFFDSGTPIPKKSVILTFDDGYEDFYTNVYPILQAHNFKATLFLPTGLVGNPGFLTWDQIGQMRGSTLVYFANHTWSHKSVAVSKADAEKEIDTAEQQLKDNSMDQDLVFAYPYGTITNYAEEILQNRGFNLAFTTRPGAAECKQQRFNLPRVRIGNTPLSAYGF